MDNNTTFSADRATQTATDTIHKVADKARDLKDGVLQSAKSAVDATRDVAAESMDKAEERVEKWRTEIDPAMADMAAKAQALAERSIHYCAETTAQMREQMDKYTEATTRYVTEKPGKSIAIAAATGAALTLATLALLRRRGD